MKQAVFCTRHLYGPGGGASAVISLMRAVRELGYSIKLYHDNGPAHTMFANTLGELAVGTQPYFPGCSYGADLLLNIDHFHYEAPLAKLNGAFIFHPHGATKFSGGRDNVPPQGYQRLSSVSAYTNLWCREEWGLEVPVLYLPIERHFTVGRKQHRILHVSRFSPPQELADKGHAQMIRAFQWMCDSNSDIRDHWEFAIAGSLEDNHYFQYLQSLAQGYNITFYPNVVDSGLRVLYATSAFYWHATGASLPQIHGAQEHLGLTTLEAMASGAVPVVLGTGGQTEVVESEVTGVCCTDTQTIGRVTLELIDRPGEWSILSRNAAVAASRWQDWGAFVQRVENWLRGEPIPALPRARQEIGRAPYVPPEDVCAVIPTRNAAQLMGTLLKSLYKTEPNIGQVVVIDDGSEDDTEQVVLAAFRASRRSQDIYLCPEGRIGYAAANMKALSETDKPFLLALNNDIVCEQPGWLERMLVQMTDPDVGVVGPKLLFPNGTLQHAGGRIDLNRPDICYHHLYGQLEQPGAWQAEDAPFVTGACLLARRNLWRWERLGEGIAYEDANLCLLAHADGYKVMYEPAARLVHMEGQTRSANPENALLTKQARDAFLERWYPVLRSIFPYMLGVPE